MLVVVKPARRLLGRCSDGAGSAADIQAVADDASLAMAAISEARFEALSRKREAGKAAETSRKSLSGSIEG